MKISKNFLGTFVLDDMYVSDSLIRKLLFFLPCKLGPKRWYWTIFFLLFYFFNI